MDIEGEKIPAKQQQFIEEITSVEINDSPLTCIESYNPESVNLLIGFDSGEITTINTIDEISNKRSMLKLHDNGITSACWIHKNMIASSGGLDIKLTDIEKEIEIRKFKAHTGDIIAVKANKFGNILISASHDKTIMMWDTRIIKPYACIIAHGGDITSIDISNDSTCLVSASIDGYCRLWDIFS